MKALDKLKDVEVELTDVIATDSDYLNDPAIHRFLNMFCLSPVDDKNCVAKLLYGLCEGNYIDDDVMLNCLSYAVYNNYPLHPSQMNKLYCKPSLNHGQVKFFLEELMVHPRFFDKDLSNIIGARDLVKYKDALCVHLNNNVNIDFLEHCLLSTSYGLAYKMKVNQRVGLIERLLVDSEGGNKKNNKAINDMAMEAYGRLDDSYRDIVRKNIDWVEI